jgi:mannosyltransferase OCH1-like enzyme
LHQIWHAVHFPEPPENYRQGARSFQEKHPGWLYKFWDDQASRSFIASNYRWFLPTYMGYSHWAKRVDALRYFLLHYFGGVYVDMDAECWKNIEPMLADFGFVGCSNYRWPGEVGNGFLAAAPGHLLLGKIIHELPLTAKKNIFDSTGPAFLSKQIDGFANATGDVKIYPPHYVYPQDATGKWRVDRNHPEIYVWSYMDGLWCKPAPRPRILRGFIRVKNKIMSLFYRIFAN